MQRISKVLCVLLAGLLFFGCDDFLKFAKFAYEECLGPADEGEEVFVLYKFDQNFFVPPGKLTMKTKVNSVNRDEDLPPAVRFDFLYKDKNVVLFDFQEDLDFDNNGRLPTLTLTFNEPGVLFQKKQTIRLSFEALFVALVLSNWRYDFKYTPGEPAIGILPLKPVRPRSPMSISVGEYEDF